MDVKKRIMASIAAFVMLFASAQVSIIAEGEFTICDTSFENNEIAFVGGKTEYTDDDAKSGKRSVRILDYSDRESAPRISLSDVNREARSEISVWIKPEITEGNAKISLLLFTQDEEKGDKVYTVASANSSGSWTKLTGKIFTKYMTMSVSPQIGVIVQTDDGFVGYLMDDLKITSDKQSAGTDNPPPAVPYNGKYTLRAAFENNTYEAFKTNDTAEYIITDEVPAHTGRYSMKITHRTASDGTMMIYFPGAAKDAKIEFSCWVRNKPGDVSRNYTLQGIIPTGEGKKWPIVSSATPATDKGWSQVTGVID